MNDLFKDLLSEKLPRFEVREGQIRMFEDIQDAYHSQKTYLIEAGTGTGKSLAYLIPALLWAQEKGEPTVVATHTIALQEQLMQKDIPFLLEAFDLDLKVVLMKGMSNYVCLRKLYDAQHEVPESLLTWSQRAVEGSRSELPVIPSHDLWEQIGVEAESCTYAKCPHYKECFYFKARKKAADAHLIVANHHLLFADLSIREEAENYTEAAVLPPFSRLILDEAHHIEDVATHYYADRVSKRGIIHVLGRLLSDRGTGKLVTLHRRICEAYPEGDILGETVTLLLPDAKRHLVDLVHQAFEAITTFTKGEDKLRIQEKHLQDPVWIEQLKPAVQAVLDAGKEFLSQVLLLEGKIKQVGDSNLQTKCDGVLAEIGGICARLQKSFEVLHAFIFSPLEPTRVRWVEGGLYLISADLEIAPRLSKALFERLPTVVLCSATLSTENQFSFIRNRLGIQEAEERIYESPFDYATQTLLSVPTDLPPPNHPDFTKEASNRIWEMVQISQGGAFVLFTSYAMLLKCEQMLQERLYKHRYKLFCQGQKSRMHLLQAFKEAQKGVLFGTDSFWEGVDVVGEALRCVVIVKLPFKVPNDPLFQARSEEITRKGGSAFFDYSLPHAIVKFKQGFGRLIRNKEDRGCVICLDSRLIKKPYGKKFLESLPSCPSLFETTKSVLPHIQNFYHKRD